MCHADSKAVVSGETVSNAELIDFSLTITFLRTDIDLTWNYFAPLHLVNAVSANYNSH